MTEFREYPIYKKRDGQRFNQVGYIYSDSFENAKKDFAKQMTDDNWNKSNNINWLTVEDDEVDCTGWYDLSYEPKELFCSESSILEGFDNWYEDVYMWELRDK